MLVETLPAAVLTKCRGGLYNSWFKAVATIENEHKVYRHSIRIQLRYLIFVLDFSRGTPEKSTHHHGRIDIIRITHRSKLRKPKKSKIAQLWWCDFRRSTIRGFSLLPHRSPITPETYVLSLRNALKTYVYRTTVPMFFRRSAPNALEATCA
jgi:hypothetical protein